MVQDCQCSGERSVTVDIIVLKMTPLMKIMAMISKLMMIAMWIMATLMAMMTKEEMKNDDRAWQEIFLAPDRLNTIALYPDQL